MGGDILIIDDEERSGCAVYGKRTRTSGARSVVARVGKTSCLWPNTSCASIAAKKTATSTREKQTMPRALWNGAIIADSDSPIEVEGNQYFPSTTVNRDHLRPSQTTTVCSWKGTANYYDVVANGEINKDAAWYYPNPKDAAAKIKDHIAFWRGVEIE